MGLSPAKGGHSLLTGTVDDEVFLPPPATTTTQSRRAHPRSLSAGAATASTIGAAAAAATAALSPVNLLKTAPPEHWRIYEANKAAFVALSEDKTRDVFSTPLEGKQRSEVYTWMLNNTNIFNSDCVEMHELERLVPHALKDVRDGFKGDAARAQGHTLVAFRRLYPIFKMDDRIKRFTLMEAANYAMELADFVMQTRTKMRSIVYPKEWPIKTQVEEMEKRVAALRKRRSAVYQQELQDAEAAFRRMEIQFQNAIETKIKLENAVRNAVRLGEESLVSQMVGLEQAANSSFRAAMFAAVEGVPAEIYPDVLRGALAARSLLTDDRKVADVASDAVDQGRKRAAIAAVEELRQVREKHPRAVKLKPTTTTTFEEGPMNAERVLEAALTKIRRVTPTVDNQRFVRRAADPEGVGNDVKVREALIEISKQLTEHMKLVGRPASEAPQYGVLMDVVSLAEYMIELIEADMAWLPDELLSLGVLKPDDEPVWHCKFLEYPRSEDVEDEAQIARDEVKAERQAKKDSLRNEAMHRRRRTLTPTSSFAIQGGGGGAAPSSSSSSS